MRIIGVLLIAVAGISSVALAGQQPDFTIHVNVPLVSVEVSVTDSNGKAITNLTRDDFVVMEEGSPKEIRNFSPVETPYNILLVFDRSGSTAGAWPFLRQAMSRFFETMRPQDRIAIAAFDGGAQMLASWRDARSAQQDIRISPTSRGTNFYGAVDWSVRQMRNVKGRKGVVIFTDGRDSRLAPQTIDVDGATVMSTEYKVPQASADSNFQKTLRSARQSGIPFFFVAVNTDRNLQKGMAAGGDLLAISQIYGAPTGRLYLAEARIRMERIAEFSGGHVVFPRQPDEVVPVYEQISRELGTSYSIGIAPTIIPGDYKLRRISVRVRNPELRVTQSREGYYTGGKLD